MSDESGGPGRQRPEAAAGVQGHVLRLDAPPQVAYNDAGAAGKAWQGGDRVMAPGLVGPR